MGNLDYGRWVPVIFGDIKPGLGCGQHSMTEPARPPEGPAFPTPIDPPLHQLLPQRGYGRMGGDSLARSKLLAPMLPAPRHWLCKSGKLARPHTFLAFLKSQHDKHTSLWSAGCPKWLCSGAPLPQQLPRPPHSADPETLSDACFR